MTSLAASTALQSIPTGAGAATIQAEDFDVRWRDDTQAPTPTEGFLLEAGVSMNYEGDLSKLRFIEADSGAILNILYYE